MYEESHLVHHKNRTSLPTCPIISYEWIPKGRTDGSKRIHKLNFDTHCHIAPPLSLYGSKSMHWIVWCAFKLYINNLIVTYYKIFFFNIMIWALFWDTKIHAHVNCCRILFIWIPLYVVFHWRAFRFIPIVCYDK